MSLTLIIAVAALGLTALFVTTASRPALRTAFADQNTMVGLGDPAAETLTVGQNGASNPTTDWNLTSVDDLSTAEMLLDCLENQGFADRELVILGNSSFAVRWR